MYVCMYVCIHAHECMHLCMHVCMRLDVCGTSPTNTATAAKQTTNPQTPPSDGTGCDTEPGCVGDRLRPLLPAMLCPACARRREQAKQRAKRVSKPNPHALATPPTPHNKAVAGDDATCFRRGASSPGRCRRLATGHFFSNCGKAL